MNPPDPADRDQPFDDLLAAYDAGLAGEQPPTPGTEAALAPEVRHQFERALDCLQRLERARRQAESHSLRMISVLSPADAVTMVTATGQFQIGKFHIVRKIGQGGCGIVYLAHDPVADRPVALKVPRPEVLVSAQHSRRFLREAQAAASLDHPHIVPLYEAGEIGSFWYLASAYCEGPTLADWLRGQHTPVPEREAAELVSLLAGAVQHAHNRGVWHRDIKPGNILLQKKETGEPEEKAEPSAGSPGSSATLPLSAFLPRLTDFGLAKVVDGESDLSATGDVMGTAAYMAPEQALGRVGDVGPWTDVYALGVVLYELLTGQVPFRRAASRDTLTLVLEEEPDSPRRLRPDLFRRLEAICLQCLDNEPRKRYASAGALADDLKGFLADDPPPQKPVIRHLRRAWKWLRKRPGALGLAASACMAGLALGLAGVRHYFPTPEPDRARPGSVTAESPQPTLSRAEYAETILSARRAYEGGAVAKAKVLLRAQRPSPDHPEDQRGFEWHYLWRLCHRERLSLLHHSAVYALGLSPDGMLVAAGGDPDGEDPKVHVWNTATGERQQVLHGFKYGIWSTAFSPDGRTLAAGGGMAWRGSHIVLFDTTTGKPRSTLSASQDLGELIFSPDGKRLAAGGGSNTGAFVELWDVTAGKQVSRFPVAGSMKRINGLAFASDGKHLAAARPDGLVTLHDVDTGSSSGRFSQHKDAVQAVALCCLPGLAQPGLELFASGSLDGTVMLWRGDSTELLLGVCAHGSGVRSVAYSSKGYLASAGDDDTVKLWDINRPSDPRLLATLRGHARGVWNVRFAADGLTLASGCRDGTVKIWDADRWRDVRRPRRRSEIWCVAFSPDGRTLVTAGKDDKVMVWDRATGESRGVFKTADYTAFGSNPPLQGKERLQWKNGTVKLATSQTGNSAREFHVGPKLSAAAATPDGRTVVTGEEDGTVRFWDAATGQCRPATGRHAGAVRCLAFAADGKTLASAGDDGVVMLWDPATAQELLTLDGQVRQVTALAFAPDGLALASGSQNGEVRIWRAGVDDARGP